MFFVSFVILCVLFFLSVIYKGFYYLIILQFLPLICIITLFFNSFFNFSVIKMRNVSLLHSLFALVVSFFLLLDSYEFNIYFIFGDCFFRPVLPSFMWVYNYFPLILDISFSITPVSSLFVLMTNIIVVFCVLITWNWVPNYFSTRLYLILIFSIQFSCLNFFISSNLLLFYIFFESVLIPMYLLIGVWGLRDRKIHASYQFFLYTFFGSLFMIVSIIILGYYMNTFELLFVERYWWFFIENEMFSLELFLWLFFFISFAIKVPMVPFHIWLPEAHVEAPTAGSIILAALLLKFGTYGFYRILVVLLPFGTNYFTRFVICLSLMAILYASMINFIQIDLKKIIAYSSVSHMGYVTLGLILDNPEGLVGALYMMLTHGFISGSLFYIVGILYERYGTRNIFYYGGLKNIMPIFTFFFFFLTLSNMNLPLTAGFVSEFLVLIGSASLTSKFIVFLAAFGLITNGIYCIWLFNRLCFGNFVTPQKTNVEFKDLDYREFIILFLFSFIIVLMGLFPNSLLYVLESEVYFVLWSKNVYFI